MADERPSILNQLEGSWRLVKYLVAGVSDEEARRAPVSSLAPIIWQIGHLGLTNCHLGRLAGAPLAIPDNYPALFGAWSGARAEYPDLDAVVETFDSSHHALAQFATTADFTRSLSALPQYFKTFGEMLIFICTHSGYHAGKVGTLRNLLGKPAIWTASHSVDLLMSGLALPSD